MTTTDIRAGRLSQEQLAENFSDHHPPLSSANAKVESDRSVEHPNKVEQNMKAIIKRK